MPKMLVIPPLYLANLPFKCYNTFLYEHLRKLKRVVCGIP